jgi:predicted DNA-binding transcriptional regulator AlpA
MKRLSTHQVAKIVGLDPASLSRYIKAGKITAPPETMAGGIKLRLWSESDIEGLRKALPKIANGRKTRYQKKQSAVGTQQSAKAKQKTQARAPVLQKEKPRKPKKKT